MPKKADWQYVLMEPDGHSACCKFVPIASSTLSVNVYTEEVHATYTDLLQSYQRMSEPTPCTRLVTYRM